MFDKREPHFPVARDYFVGSHPLRSEVIKNEPWLAEQAHVVGEALIQRYYFEREGLVLMDPSSSQVLDQPPPDREPDAVHDDAAFGSHEKNRRH